MEKIGIQNTKEALLASMLVLRLIAEEVKDGFQAQDLVTVVQRISANEEKKALLEAALKDMTKIPAEIKDLDLGEGIELAGVLIAELPKLIAAIQK
jgi:hypothetical protein